MQGKALSFSVKVEGRKVLIIVQKLMFIAQAVSEGMRLPMDIYNHYIWITTVLQSPLTPTPILPYANMGTPIFQPSEPKSEPGHSLHPIFLVSTISLGGLNALKYPRPPDECSDQSLCEPGDCGVQSYPSSVKQYSIDISGKVSSMFPSSPTSIRSDLRADSRCRRNRGGHKPNKGHENKNRGPKRDKNNDIQGKIHKGHSCLSPQLS